jgi:hypothetical protein
LFLGPFIAAEKLEAAAAGSAGKSEAGKPDDVYEFKTAAASKDGPSRSRFYFSAKNFSNKFLPFTYGQNVSEKRFREKI